MPSESFCGGRDPAAAARCAAFYLLGPEAVAATFGAPKSEGKRKRANIKFAPATVRRKMSNNLKGIRTTLAAGITALVCVGGAQAQLDQALQVARQSTEQGAQAQAQINQLADDADNAERQYLALQEQIQGQEVYLAQQRVFLRSQENELTSLQSQLERVGNIERDLTPMLLEMYVRLEAFVEQDLPFQIESRRERLADIQEALGDAAIPPAEKYRVLLNAYEAEAAAGRSLRAYSQEVMVNDVPQQADILQVGRVALIRRVGDRVEMLTKANPEWRPVPGGMAANVDRAFRIANEVTTPEVFVAPVPGPETAQ
jgi:hypothetical protein